MPFHCIDIVQSTCLSVLTVVHIQNGTQNSEGKVESAMEKDLAKGSEKKKQQHNINNDILILICFCCDRR